MKPILCPSCCATNSITAFSAVIAILGLLRIHLDAVREWRIAGQAQEK